MLVTTLTSILSAVKYTANNLAIMRDSGCLCLVDDFSDRQFSMELATLLRAARDLEAEIQSELGR